MHLNTDSHTETIIMLSWTKPDFVRESHAVLTVYLTLLIGAYSNGFSAVAIPDIKNEMRQGSQSNLISAIQASSDDLSWFGEMNTVNKIIS